MLLTQITGQQIRCARERLGLTRDQLARGARVNRVTVCLYEGHGPEPVSAGTLVLGRLLRFLEAEGVVFSPDGVSLDRPQSTMKATIHREAVAP